MTKSIQERKKEYGFSDNDILFCIAVTIFLITVILDMSLINNDARLTQLFRYLSYGIVCFKFIRDVYDKKNLTKYLIGLGILGLGFIVNRNQVMILYSIIILASIGIEDKMIMKVYFIVHSMMTFAIVALSQLGVILDYVHISKDRIRHFLGFDYTTMAPIFMIFIVAEYLYLRKGKIKLCEYIIGMGFSLLFFKWTDTNYTFLLSVGMLTFFYINGNWMEKGYITHTFRKLIYLVPWIVATISIWAQWAYNENNAIWAKINELIHKRLELGNNAIKTYGISLLGNKIEWVTNSYYNKCAPEGYNYVDSAYLQLILQQGIICFVMVLAIYSGILALMIKSKKYYAAWIIVFLLVFNMTEPKLFHIVYNPFIMLAFAMLSQEAEAFIKNKSWTPPQGIYK